MEDSQDKRAERSPGRVALAAFAAFLLGNALALSAWQRNHLFVDAGTGPLHLLGIPLAIAGACIVGLLMAKGLGLRSDGHLTLAALLGAGGVIAAILLLWFLPVVLGSGH